MINLSLILNEHEKEISIIGDDVIIFEDSTYDAVRLAILNKYNSDIDNYIESFGLTNQENDTVYATMILKDSINSEELKKFKDNFLNLKNYEDGNLMISFSISKKDLIISILKK